MCLLPRSVILGSLLLAATARASAPPVPPEDAAAMLTMLASTRAIRASDAERLIRENALPRVARVGKTRCGTPTFLAMREWLKRERVPVLRDPPPSQGHLDSTKFPVRVFYNSIFEQTLAKSAVVYAEETWQRQIVDRGYRQPWTLGDPDAVQPGMDFYFADDNEQYSGLTVPIADLPSTPICDCSSRVFVVRSLSGTMLADVIEHEFNHTTQAATDCGESISAWENFATAVEYLAFPKNYELTHYDMAVFQAWPDYSLDFWTQSPGATGPDEYYQYGASLFPIFLLERFGGNDPVFLKDVWESFKQDGTMNMGPTGGGNCSSGNDPDWFQGLDGLLKTHGSDLKTAFSEFAEWRAVVGPHDDGHHFLRGSNYPEPSMGASLSQLPVSGYLDVREYGSRFIEFLPQGDERPLSIIVTAKPEASWSGAVLLWSDTQPVERLGLVYDDKAIARLTTPALGGVTRVLIVVNQIDDGSHKTDDADYFSNRYFRYQVEQLAAPGLDAGMPPDTAPPGLDAAPGPDAPAGPDATPSPTDAGMAADAGSSTANPGCGCSAPGAGASAMLALLALAGVKRRRLSPRA